MIENNIEFKEKDPKPMSTVFIVRHTDTNYEEELINPETKEDLTDEGKKQAKIVSEKISNELAREDKVYIMSSPRVRTENTANLIKSTLDNSGRETVKLEGGKNSLRNFKILDEAGKDIYSKKNYPEEYLSDMKKIFNRIEKESDYYLKYRAQTVENPHNQDIAEYRKKVGVFIRRIIAIARKRSPKNEKLILVTHGEWLDSVLELYFHQEIRSYKDSSDKGEIIKMEIFGEKVKFYFRDKFVEANL